MTSSVGKKFVMGITGLLLCGFLVTHLAGNLLMLVSADAYNGYAHALHSKEWLIKFAELGLLVLFVSHIFLAIVTSRENRQARGPVGYDQQTTKIENRISEPSIAPKNWMFVTGAIVLGFLILHLCDFTFESFDDSFYETTLDGKTVDKEPFEKALSLLQNPLTCGVYLVGCLFLGWHLGHGFSSAFQSLGINHPKYNGLIRYSGIAFAIAIGGGFAFFPLWAFIR